MNIYTCFRPLVDVNYSITCYTFIRRKKRSKKCIEKTNTCCILSKALLCTSRILKLKGSECTTIFTLFIKFITFTFVIETYRLTNIYQLVSGIIWYICLIQI